MFCWFASTYAAVAILVASLLRKKSVVVIGGVDVADEPEFGYGLWRSRWKGTIVGWAIRRASKVLIVDESLREDVISRAKYDGPNIEIFPTGYDPQLWNPKGTKKPMVLTVSAIQNDARLKIKGIDVLFDAARSLPRVNFVLIGFEPVRFPELKPPANLVCAGIKSRKELLTYYRLAKVYCQPSRREGLSNTLCEAMLCGAIPVATDVGGTATAVGDCGIVVRANATEELVSGIKRALKMSAAVGSKARKRITKLFPAEARKQRLIELVRGLVA